MIHIHDDAAAMAVAETLARVEASKVTQGWGIAPILIGLFTHPTTNPTDLMIEVDPSLVSQAVWHEPDPANPGQHLPAADVLRWITTYVADQQAGFRDWLSPRERTFVGFALLFVGWETSFYPGYEHGDLNAVPAMAEAEVRIVAGLDIAGRYYQVFRKRGHTVTTASVMDPAPDGLPYTNIGAGLTRLVDLARTATGHHGHANGHNGHANGRSGHRP